MRYYAGGESREGGVLIPPKDPVAEGSVYPHLRGRDGSILLTPGRIEAYDLLGTAAPRRLSRGLSLGREPVDSNVFLYVLRADSGMWEAKEPLRGWLRHSRRIASDSAPREEAFPRRYHPSLGVFGGPSRGIVPHGPGGPLGSG